MNPREIPLVAVLAISGILALLLVARPALTRERGGKMLAFVALFLLPVIVVYMGLMEHMERSKTTGFCLSCHIMEPYGRSLHVDDKEYVPARHYQNNWVPREKACYTCHTDYALYGDVRSKLRGLRHITAQYLGTVPDTVKLYNPYNNRECLHCHGGARGFESNSGHTEDDTTLAAMKANRLSCIASGCHDVIHDVRELKGAKMWPEGER